MRDLAADKRIFNERAETVQLRTHDPRVALDGLWRLDRRHVFLEGGPTLAAAFVRAGLIDEVVVYVAPMLLGAGTSAIGDLGITTITDALRLRITDVTTLGAGAETNVRLTMTPTKKD